MLNPSELRRAEAELNVRKAAERALWILRTDGMPNAAEAAGAPRAIVRQMKAALAGTTTAEAGALAELQQQAEALTSTVASVGFFDALRGDCIEGELWARYVAAIADPIAGSALQGRGIRVTSMAFDSKTLQAQRAGTIIVLTKELLRFASSISIIETLLRRAIARATDALVIPQLLAGAPSIVASTDDATADIRQALLALPSGADARFRIGIGPAVAKRISMITDATTGRRIHPDMTPTGGTLVGLPCSVSEALTDDAILTDGTAIVATASDVELHRSEAATLEMDTAPTNAANNGGSPVAPVETTVVSMFQVDCVAMRITRAFDWAGVRPVHSVKIAGAGSEWGIWQTSPPT